MPPRSEHIRTIDADANARKGRLAKAQQFLRVANDARALAEDADVSDAAATLYVHAGIAAADALWARSLGHYSRGENHQQSIQLLQTVNVDAAKHLKVLLNMKTRAGYGHDPVGIQDLIRAERAAQSLLTIAMM